MCPTGITIPYPCGAEFLLLTISRWLGGDTYEDVVRLGLVRVVLVCYKNHIWIPMSVIKYR